MFLFTSWLAFSVLVVNRIRPGLDQKLAVPEDSYLYTHFLNMERFLSVGPPVYFVLRADGGYDFSQEANQNLVCSSGGW
jgi:Niemann-Pick C1 protein